MNTLRLLISAGLLALAPQSFAGLTWIIEDLEFFDGTSATGSFNYDAHTGIVDEVHIATEAGDGGVCATPECVPEDFRFTNLFAAQTYDSSFGFLPDIPVPGFAFFNSMDFDDGSLIGDRILLISPGVEPTTPGTFPLPVGASLEWICDNDFCFFDSVDDPFRSNVSGSITAVPEPGSLALLSIGCLALLVRRRPASRRG